MTSTDAVAPGEAALRPCCTCDRNPAALCRQLSSHWGERGNPVGAGSRRRHRSGFADQRRARDTRNRRLPIAPAAAGVADVSQIDRGVFSSVSVAR